MDLSTAGLESSVSSTDSTAFRNSQELLLASNPVAQKSQTRRVAESLDLLTKATRPLRQPVLESEAIAPQEFSLRGKQPIRCQCPLLLSNRLRKTETGSNSIVSKPKSVRFPLGNSLFMRKPKRIASLAKSKEVNASHSSYSIGRSSNQVELHCSRFEKFLRLKP